MQCKHCNYPDTRVVKTENGYQNSNEIYRRRECIKCGLRFTTREHARDNYKNTPYKTIPPLKVLPK